MLTLSFLQSAALPSSVENLPGLLLTFEKEDCQLWLEN